MFSTAGSKPVNSAILEVLGSSYLRSNTACRPLRLGCIAVAEPWRSAPIVCHAMHLSLRHATPTYSSVMRSAPRATEKGRAGWPACLCIRLQRKQRKLRDVRMRIGFACVHIGRFGSPQNILEEAQTVFGGKVSVPDDGDRVQV